LPPKQNGGKPELHDNALNKVSTHHAVIVESHTVNGLHPELVVIFPLLWYLGPLTNPSEASTRYVVAIKSEALPTPGSLAVRSLSVTWPRKETITTAMLLSSGQPHGPPS
jgi:hypothetical protein